MKWEQSEKISFFPKQTINHNELQHPMFETYAHYQPKMSFWRQMFEKEGLHLTQKNKKFVIWRISTVVNEIFWACKLIASDVSRYNWTVITTTKCISHMDINIVFDFLLSFNRNRLSNTFRPKNMLEIKNEIMTNDNVFKEWLRARSDRILQHRTS